MADGFVINTRGLLRRTSGVERYTRELAGCLGDRLRSEGPGRPLSSAAGHLWEQAILPVKIKKGELLWSPANTGPLAVSRQVLTLHDTSVLEHPTWFRPLFSRWYRAVLPVLVHRVRRVLAVSETSRQRIQTLFSLPPERVAAIPAGVDMNHFHPVGKVESQAVSRRYHLAGDYLLFVGTLEPRKNLAGLVAAWKLAEPYLPGIELVIAGGPAPNFASLPPLPHAPALRFLGYVPDADLPALYAGARIFLLPSLEEGFGLTVLEAMACGTPVIASTGGALPETVGPAGILLDPRDSLAWAQAIVCLLDDRDGWEELRQRGLEQACRYSWDRSARQVWQTLEAAR